MLDGEMTVAGAYAKIDSHEDLCAVRYKSMDEKINWILSGLGMMFIGLVAWMAIQLYTLEPLRAAAYASTSTQVTTTHTTGTHPVN